MKSEKRLQLIMTAYEKCKDSWDMDAAEAADLLYQIILTESSCKIGKFDLFDYVADDKLRPALCGIYHDKGFRIASDSKILIKYQHPYEESLEGKIISKSGEFIEGRYLKYEAVFPKASDEYTAYKINLDSFNEQLNECRAKYALDYKTDKKMLRDKKWSHLYLVKIGNAYFNPYYFDLLARFGQVIGTNEILIKDASHAALMYQGENKGLIMPRCVEPKDEDEHYIINL